MVAYQNRKKKTLKSKKRRQIKNKKNIIDAKPVAALELDQEINRGLQPDNAATNIEEALQSTETNGETDNNLRSQFLETIVNMRKNLKDPFQTGHEHQSHFRHSFVIRVTVDENYQFRRVEAEHIASNTKQNFLHVRGDDLVAFMKACVTATINSSTHSVPAKQKADPLAGTELKTEPSISISGVQLLDSEHLYDIGFTLASDKPFVVQTHFQFLEPELAFPANHESSYEIKVHIHEITRGISKLLVTHRASLIPNTEGYVVRLKVPGLAFGLYRLFTVITLAGIKTMASSYDGPIIQVI